MKKWIKKSFHRQLLVCFGVVALLPLLLFGVSLIQTMETKINSDYEKKVTEQAELLLQAKKERARIMDDAAKMKASIIEQAKAQAQEEASKVLEQARLEITAEKESALQDIRKEVAMLSMNVSEKILRADFASEDVQKRYVDKVMEELNNRKDSIVKN